MTDKPKPEAERITDDMVNCWRINYGLDKMSPAAAMRWWDTEGKGWAPSGAVAAVGLLLQEREATADELRRLSAVEAERDALHDVYKQGMESLRIAVDERDALQAQVARLEADNANLRAGIRELVTASGAPIMGAAMGKEQA